MILGLRANKKSFRAVRFTGGLNLILAQRSVEAGEKDTTNALGKSTLIEIIDFCLGSNAIANKGLCIEPLQGWEFTLDLAFHDSDVQVTRAVDAPAKVFLTGDTSGWPIQPDEYAGRRFLDIADWRTVLGFVFFGLFPDRKDAGGARPSPRSLLSYFLRSSPAAYLSPIKYFDTQPAASVQLHNAYLLGLNWEQAANWQVIKEQRAALSALRKAIRLGAIEADPLSVGELETERVRLQAHLEREQAALSTFQVLPQYREVEREANSLTSEIHDEINADMVDRRRLQRYEELSDLEASPAESKLEELYAGIGVELPGAAVRTLEEARTFNSTIVANRRSFIAAEIDRLRTTIAKREARVFSLTDRRAQLLQLLAGHGALEEYTRLQERHAQAKARLEGVAQRIAQTQQASARSDDLRLKEVEVRRSAKIDHEERRAKWSQAIELFARFSQELYNVPGKLVIDIGDAGYRINVDMTGGPSEGISKMKIFCYDLMLVTLARQKGLGIDFLIHDSTIFDGVDPRQRAHALELAANVSEEFGFQYICALNSDMVPVSDFRSEFNYEDYVRLRLTDDDPAGSLLGFRF